MPILQYILTIKRNLSQAASRQAMEIDRRRILSTNQRKMLWRKENTRYQLLSTLYFENTLLYLLETPGGKEETWAQKRQWGNVPQFGRFLHRSFPFFFHNFANTRYTFFPPHISDTIGYVEWIKSMFGGLLLVPYFRQIASFLILHFLKYIDLGVTSCWPWCDLEIGN